VNGESALLQTTSPKDRLTIFLPSLSGGGAEKIMVFLANAFADRGLEVCLVAADGQGPRRSEVSGMVRVVDLGVTRVARAVGPLAGHLLNERPDAVLSALTHANVVAVMAARLAGYRGRVVVSERNSLAHLRASSGLKARVRSMLARRAYRASDCVVAVSRQLEDELAAFLGNGAPDLRTIYNPVELDAVIADARREPPVGLPGRPEDRLVAVGRLTKQKGFDVLLGAFARMAACDRQLVILGEGPERPALEALASELGIAKRVLMPGHVGNVPAVLARSSVFVLSSRYEGLPNALLEALACGCHVVSTDCPTGPSEILRQPADGELVPVEDEGAMAAAIERAFLKAGRKDATSLLARFSPDRIVADYLDTLLRPALVTGLTAETR